MGPSRGTGAAGGRAAAPSRLPPSRGRGVATPAAGGVRPTSGSPKTAAFFSNQPFRSASFVALLCSSPQMITCLTPGRDSGSLNSYPQKHLLAAGREPVRESRALVLASSASLEVSSSSAWGSGAGSLW